METTAAILLRRTKLSDTSLIIGWWTEAHGKIKTVAKGARRQKSPFAGKLDLFFEADIQFVRARRSDLHTLREVALRKTNEGVRLHLKNVRLASYFVELIELVTEPEHAAPELFSLLQRAFEHLSKRPATRRALLHFEAELVRFLGIQGEDGVSPAGSIGRVYGRLPALRREALAQFPDGTA